MDVLLKMTDKCAMTFFLLLFLFNKLIDSVLLLKHILMRKC